jgi:hypothetical protein
VRLAHAGDSRRRVALDDGTVLGEREGDGGVTGRGPVPVLRSALHVVEVGAVELELDAQLHHRHRQPLPGADGAAGCLDRPYMPGADRRGRRVRVHDVDHPAAGDGAGERLCDGLVDLSPGGVGDRGQVAMQVVHGSVRPLRDPMVSDVGGGESAS